MTWPDKDACKKCKREEYRIREIDGRKYILNICSFCLGGSACSPKKVSKEWHL